MFGLKKKKSYPLCKDCYYCEDIIITSFPYCYHPKSIKEINLINGKKEYTFCQVMRCGFNNRCGEKGKLFRPKERKE